MTGLPYLLTHIVEREGNRILILDRRCFPFEKRYVPCKDEWEIAHALSSMVTQGGGPLEVALEALLFLSAQCRDLQELENRMRPVVEARQTNLTMRRTVREILSALDGDANWKERLPILVKEKKESFLVSYHKMGRYGAALLPQEARVLTTCFAEHSFLLALQYAREQGKEVSVLVNETRPYLQGSRLTAPSLEELGFPVSVITDGMGSHFMAEGKVNVYLTALDAYLEDGTVVNKTGTLANAISAAYYRIPYIAFSLSQGTGTRSTLKMEERDGREVVHCLGKETSTPTMGGLYPAFDIIGYDLVSAVVTPEGIVKGGRK